jgi:hypothetical protein
MEREAEMTRLSLIKLAALGVATAIAGLSLPAAAQSVAECQRQTVIGDRGIFVDRIDAFSDTIAMQLRQRGYDVESVEPWGGCVRAFINDPGGRSHMEFFDPDTLEPLSTN